MATESECPCDKIRTRIHENIPWVAGSATRIPDTDISIIANHKKEEVLPRLIFFRLFLSYHSLFFFLNRTNAFEMMFMFE